MQKLSYLMLFVIVCSMLLYSCFKDSASPAHTIDSFSPTSGAVGTTVTITGKNFDPTPANNTVKFNGTTAVVTEATATSLKAVVPEGVTSGAISVSSKGMTVMSTSSFTKVLIPHISSFSPTQGVVGTTVIITGVHFVSQPIYNTVQFNGVTAVVTQASQTSLTAIVPPGATTGPITVDVINEGVSDPSATPFVVLDSVISNGLVAYYPLAGDTKDYSGQGNDLTPTNITYTTDHKGTPNGAASFNGTAKAESIGTTDFKNSPSFSLSFWYQPLATPPTGINFSVVEALGNNPSPQPISVIGYYDQYNTTYINLLTNAIPSTTGNQYDYLLFNVTRNAWHNIVLIYDDSTKNGYVYIDNILVSTVSNIHNTGAIVPLKWQVGEDEGTSYIKGNVSNIKCYNRPLSASEVTQLFNE